MAEASSTAPQGRQLAACPVCPRGCRLADGQLGACGARIARGGEVLPRFYGTLSALALDPVEKKPLAMWRPGSYVLSLGGLGCNLHCPFCQNHSISQCRGGVAPDVQTRRTSPEEVVETALSLRKRGNVGIAYTYNEPFVSWEFLRDTASLAHEAGLCNVVVSNGLVNDAVLDEVLPLIDAINIDLKGFTPQFYALCLGGGRYGEGPLDLGKRAFECVQNCIRRCIAAPGCHTEVTTLVVPEAESAESLQNAARWLAGLDANTPYHISQYHPAYRWNRTRPLPDARVRAVAETARKYLKHVFIGNM